MIILPWLKKVEMEFLFFISLRARGVGSPTTVTVLTAEKSIHPVLKNNIIFNNVSKIIWRECQHLFLIEGLMDLMCVCNGQQHH